MAFNGFLFFKQKTTYEMLRRLVGSEMCIRDRPGSVPDGPSRAGQRVGELLAETVEQALGHEALSLIHI